MATYTYRCDFMEDGTLLADTLTHTFERDFPIGKAPAEVACTHHRQLAIRALDLDLPSVRIDAIGDDPFRKYHLSSAGDRAAAEQQRHIGGPRDKAEARAIQAATGRQYIGNDVSALTPREQAAIAKRG